MNPQGGAEMRAKNDAKLRERLRHIRTLDPHLPYADVASRLGISRQTVKRLSQELGLPPPEGWRHV